MVRPEWFLDTAPDGERKWLVLAVIVLLLVLRHAVIAFLSRSEKRR